MAVANDNPLGRDADSLLAAGDSRANVQPMLIAFHTLFVREHNRLCDEFKNKYPQVNSTKKTAPIIVSLVALHSNKFDKDVGKRQN